MAPQLAAAAVAVTVLGADKFIRKIMQKELVNWMSGEQ